MTDPGPGRGRTSERAGLVGRAFRFTGKEHGTALVLVLCWATVVLPPLVQSLTAPKSRQFTGSDDGGYTSLAALVNLFFTLSLTFVLIILLIRHLNAIPVDRRGFLLILLLPWLYQVSRDMFAGTSLKLGGLLYPLIVVVVWLLRPKLGQLAILGYLVGLTALISILMGALVPAKGILSSTAGEIISPDKQILPWGILIGPLTDGNPLGQFLAIGLACAFYIRRRWHRYPIALVTTFAVLWTSNRSSLAGLGIGLLVAGLVRITPRGARRAVVILLTAIAGAVVIYLPATTTANDAFTNRGYIWQASLRRWLTQPLIGLGSQWYSQSARYANNIGPTAFHGHNQFVQSLVLGGLILLVLTTLLILAVARTAGRWAEDHNIKVPAAFLVMVLVSGAFEVSLSFVHRSFLLPVTVLPIAYICFAEQIRRPGLEALEAEIPVLERIAPEQVLVPVGAEGPDTAPVPRPVIDESESPPTTLMPISTAKLRRLAESLSLLPSADQPTPPRGPVPGPKSEPEPVTRTERPPEPDPPLGGEH